MSEIDRYGPPPCSLDTAPLRDMGANVVGVDPARLMMDLGAGLEFFRDLRRDNRTIDGFAAINGIPTQGRTFDQLGRDWLAARARGMPAEQFFRDNFDLSQAALPVRDAYPGEPFGQYADYIGDRVLRTQQHHPHYLELPFPTDAPGTRFIGAFPADNDVVAIGRIWHGDIEGGRRTIDNSVYLIHALQGLIPNFNSSVSLDRSQMPTLSFAVERLAAAYGQDGDEVIAHYQRPLRKHLDFWMRGRSYLNSITHNRGEAFGRQILLPGRDHDIVFRFYSDALMNGATMQGVREESAAEDEALAGQVLSGLIGATRMQEFSRLMRDVRAACESTQDFADWQLADYTNLETIRTTDIAPVALQAVMVHLMRMAGRDTEAAQLAETINRRFWRDIDGTHGQYVDLSSNGAPTKALHAIQAYPLLVGGIVPYERAVKLANTWKDVLVRRYGALISAGTSGQQWSGDPSPFEDGKANDLFRHLVDPALTDLSGAEGEDRTWPSVDMYLVEAFTMAAIEAEANGNDPGPLLEVAELIRIGILDGMERSFYAYHYIGEKYSAVDPFKFVNGGEYGRTRATAQRGFGMSIGAHRSLVGRDLRREVMEPQEYSWRQYTLKHSIGGLLVTRAAA